MKVRRATVDDRPFLGLMMREAGFPPGGLPPLAEALRAPHVAQWLDGWMRAGDRGVLAVDDDGTPLGAAWCRALGPWTYGYIDDATPVVAIGVDPAHRGRGIGTSLLAALADDARADGVRALSLSVGRANPALRLYERVGYVRVVDEPERQIVLRLQL